MGEPETERGGEGEAAQAAFPVSVENVIQRLARLELDLRIALDTVRALANLLRNKKAGESEPPGEVREET